MLSVMYGVLAMMPTTFAIAGYVLGHVEHQP